MATLEDVPDVNDNAFYLRKAHALMAVLEENGPLAPKDLIKSVRSKNRLNKCMVTNVLAYASVHGMVDFNHETGLWGIKGVDVP